MQNELKSRKLPSLLSREEMLNILSREMYGTLPCVEYSISVSEPTFIYGEYSLGTVEHSFVTMTITVGQRSHSFRVDRLLHNDDRKRPTVVLNNFHPMYASRYFPIEELSEKDVNYLAFVYEDVASDDNDFSNGLGPLLLPNGQDTDTACGKIGIWAWANMRLVDYALTLDCVDKDNICVAGHSRLGKTALLTAAHDTRIKFALSNAAGCCGDSLAKGNSGHHSGENKRLTGELYSDIHRVFPFWFCKGFVKHTEKNYSDDFDQHFLLAAIAPRYVALGACSHDFWADPRSVQLSALAASPAWERDGLVGYAKNSFLEVGEAELNGRIGIFLIKSRHYFSRHSWKNFIDYVLKHKN
ncbi:MAG: hypothetical protein IJ309_00885 [Clostridia bacterium]|nr:hypothetical protein [Clostridia bacterium]